jgi:hypothetical protein
MDQGLEHGTDHVPNLFRRRWRITVRPSGDAGPFVSPTTSRYREDVTMKRAAERVEEIARIIEQQGALPLCFALRIFLIHFWGDSHARRVASRLDLVAIGIGGVVGILWWLTSG